MTYVYLNYENMKSIIKTVKDYADNAEKADAGTNAVNFVHHFAVDLSTMSGWKDKIQALRDKAKEIDNRVELAKHQSENGLSPKNGGDISYYVPDGMEDTTENVQKASWGLDNAKSIQEAAKSKDGKDKRGRTLEQIIEDTASLQDDPAYSAAYIDKVGIENLAQLSLDVDEKLGGKRKVGGGLVAKGEYIESPSRGGRRMADAFGHMMAAASNSWSDEEAKNKAEKLSSSVYDKQGKVNWGRVSAVNTMLSASQYGNIDGVDGTTDRGIGLSYGNQTFLTEMGKNLEKIPVRKHMAGDSEFINIGDTHNPLQGLVHAMSGNPEAGTRWISPPLDENASEDERRQAAESSANRVRKIMAYSSVGDNQWTDDWMVLADKASARASSSKPIPGDTDGVNSATTVSSIFNAVGESGAHVNLSNPARVHAAQTLARYPIGIEESAREGNEKGIYIKGPGAAEWAKSRSTQPILSDLALSNLTGEVGQNDDASSTLATSKAKFNEERISIETEEARRTGDYSGLVDAYDRQSKANGFVAGAIARDAEHRKGDADARTKFWVDAGANVVSAVPVASEASSAAKVAANAVKSQATASAKTSMMDLVANEEAAEEKANKDKYTQGKVANRVSVTESVLKSGAYTQEQLAQVAGKTGSNADSVLGEDGKVKLGTGGMSNSQYSDMKGVAPLLFRAQKTPGSGSTELAIPAFENLDQTVDNSYETAYRSAKPLSTSKGDEVAPKANEH